MAAREETIKKNERSSIVQSFTCDTCGTSFTTREGLKRHNVSMHSKKAKGIEEDNDARSQKLNVMMVPERRTTILLLGITAGVIATGFAVYFIAKGRRRKTTACYEAE